MFTGLIEDIGQLASLELYGGDVRLEVKPTALDLDMISVGDSISINGVCLTVVSNNNKVLAFDVSNESLQKTALNQLRVGDYINLERALKVGDHLGGHWVTGHVDDVAELVYLRPDARSIRLIYKAPKHLMRYLVEKGSVSLDGVSLTINEVNYQTFSVNIIPHTRNKTIIQYYQVGQKVNLEVDQLTRYIERLTTVKNETKKTSFNYQTLIDAGL